MALHQRLLRDIAEMQREPYPNIQLVPQDDLQTACLILTPDDYQPLHLTIRFNQHYPLAAPQVTIQSRVSHPNVFGDYICASILNTTEGYTPAYTLKGICIQLLSFFGSDSLDQSYGNATINLGIYKDMGCRSIEGDSYSCRQCHFQSVAQSALRGPYSLCLGDYLPIENDRAAHDDGAMQIDQADEQNTTVNHSLVDASSTTIASLPDELLLLICNHLTTQELSPFSRAWNRIGGENGLVSRFNIIRNRELICFVLKKSFDSTRLGVGVNIKTKSRIGTLESEFDLLSGEAFGKHDVRRSIQGLPFEYWLPLPISRRHYQSVKDLVQPRLEKIALAARLMSTDPMNTVYAFMNDIVVRLSAQAEARNAASSLVHASEKAIESYYHLFHLLLCLATENYNRVRKVNNTIRDFLKGRTSKTDVPNLGYLLIMVLISDAGMMQDLQMAIIREAVTRNVVWMLDRMGANMPELSYMEANAISQYRLRKTFEASKTSYRLLMFLNLFRRTINRGNKTLTQIRDELFDAHGAPPRGTAAKLASDIKDLQKVETFPEFLRIMGLPSPKASEFTTFLRNCIEASVDKGYSIWGLDQSTALQLRQKVDPEVEIRESPKPEWKSKGGCSFFPGAAKDNRHGGDSTRVRGSDQGRGRGRGRGRGH